MCEILTEVKFTHELKNTPMKKKQGAQKHASMKKKHTSVSENSGTPKWMAGENNGKPYF